MNKLLVVSGGTKGIGRAIIDRFAGEGFDVITCSRHQEDLEHLKTEIEGANKGIGIGIYQADLSVYEEAQGFIDFINVSQRVPDVLVNNTGVFFPGQVHNEEEGVLDKTLDTNLKSAYWITRGVIKEMMSRGRGHIFNICSTASIEPYVAGASYCISKYALLAMTKVLREELKEYGVKVTAVIPGSTLTPTWAGTEIPEENFIKPGDIASAIYGAFSLSDQSVVEEIRMQPMKGNIQ